MLRIAAFASSVVASTAMVLPMSNPAANQPLLHPREDGAVALEVDDAPRSGNRRLIRRRLIHRQPQKSAYRQRVARASQGSSRVPESVRFRAANRQQQPEVPTGR